MAISTSPFSGDTPPYNRNRIHRITFAVGSVKTVAHIDNRNSGSVRAYEKPRADSTDPNNVHVTERNRYITEEA